MSLGAGNLLLASAGDAGYNLTRSLRFKASASAYLNRTPSVAGNRQVFTISKWVKIGSIVGASSYLLSANTASGFNDGFGIAFASGTLSLGATSGGATIADLNTTQVFRDPSAWYHIVYAVDTTQATAANRIKLYVNGAQVTAFGTATYPAQNTSFQMNNAVPTYIGRLGYTSSVMFDGYMTEINLIDGQALTPSSFGSFNATTGVWQPARYTGTYGTNGFYLPFTDNSALTTSSNVGLGKDFSGNGNYWTTNNISITSGVTYDSMTDVPTLTSATASNFAVMNPIGNGSGTISNGNLRAVTATTLPDVGNFAMQSGKWYWEVTLTTAINPRVGVYDMGSALPTAGGLGGTAFGWCLLNGPSRVYNNNIATAYGAFNGNTGDVVMLAYDASAGKLWYGANGAWFASGDPATAANPSQTSVTGKAIVAATASGSGSNTFDYNFGQRPFSYTPPTGFLSLNTFNLPDSPIVKGNTVMDATLYTGNNASPRSITNAAGFKPDLIWVKSRSNLQSHKFTDSVRGAVNAFYTDSTSANDATPLYGSISAFNSNGFALSSGGIGISDVNGSGQTYVAWQWQAGQGSTSNNTSGSITSTVSANPSAGFSIVSYTGNATQNATVGHGLGVTPTVVFYKNKISARTWSVISQNLLGLDGFLYLNTTAIKGTGASELRASTSSVLTLPATYADINPSGETMLAYCFAPIAGYSAFGTFVGNGSVDGNFLYLGFLPKFFLLKNLTGVESWLLWDTTRGTFNAVSPVLNPNSTAIENTLASFDFVSNGVKLRASTVQTYMYWAFAENPFKNSLAR